MSRRKPRKPLRNVGNLNDPARPKQGARYYPQLEGLKRALGAAAAPSPLAEARAAEAAAKKERRLARAVSGLRGGADIDHFVEDRQVISAAKLNGKVQTMADFREAEIAAGLDRTAPLSQYRCGCGYHFAQALGRYGCPNCCGDRGADAVLVPL